MLTERRGSRRFPLTLPVAVIRPGEAEYRQLGETKNISSSGIYFVVNKAPAIGSRLEFVVIMPPEIAQRDLRLRFKGKVLRVETGPDPLVGVATTIEGYEFLYRGVSEGSLGLTRGSRGTVRLLGRIVA